MQPLDMIRSRMRIPLIGAPLFIVSYPELVAAQCKAGIIGSFPALNARPESELKNWIETLQEDLAKWDRDNPDRPSAPFAVNQIVHRSNERLDHDMGVCVDYKVPVIISSLGARREVNEAIHGYGGIVLHDVINNRFAHSAIDKGADGLIAVAAGAGGHAGMQSPFALIQEIREWFDGPLALSGAIANGRSLLAAQALGADFGYAGTLFIATQEAHASPEYKAAITEHSAEDIIYSNYFTGVHGNYLKPSIEAAGIDPSVLQSGDPEKLKVLQHRSVGTNKAWKDIWGCGQGIGILHDVPTVAAVVDRLEREYDDALAKTRMLKAG
ncbi:NAD(P)H-dependent flavin oxidoreductase [Paracoccus sp. (in: a-proteobacteria)]|uniref:NAD(P)H-dependent flavin oxidoreductase n=1 Tax=Paracoccus sp. TaxID=267 RepID=UPI003A86202E